MLALAANRIIRFFVDESRRVCAQQEKHGLRLRLYLLFLRSIAHAFDLMGVQMSLIRTLGHPVEKVKQQ